jgi:hypothetical protein
VVVNPVPINVAPRGPCPLGGDPRIPSRLITVGDDIGSLLADL